MTNEHFNEFSNRIYKWWSGLGKRKGESAILRRYDGPPDFMSLLIKPKSEPMRDLFQYLMECELFSDDYKRNDLQIKVMPILGLLSHVKYDQRTESEEGEEKDKKSPPLSIAAAMAKPKNSKPIVSEPRFRRLLQAENQVELYPMLLRTIRLMSVKTNIKANVGDLIKSVFYWNDATKEKWAFDFYRASLKIK